jgi:acyl-CoA thioesterase-1
MMGALACARWRPVRNIRHGQRPAAAESVACSCFLLAGPRRRRQAAQRRTPPLLVLGDSLSAEYGLPAAAAGWRCWSAPGARAAARVVNASVSGDTTSGGRSRLPALLAKHRPAMW